MVELINIKLNMLTVLTVECVNYVKLTTLKTDRQRYRATIFQVTLVFLLLILDVFFSLLFRLHS